MIYYVTKIIVTSVLVIAISELSKRNSFMGAILASLPLISILAILWLYTETQDVALVSNLSKNIFWFVLPSLAFFITFPLFLKFELNFYVSIGLSVGFTIGCYWLMIYALNAFGVRIS